MHVHQFAQCQIRWVATFGRFRAHTKIDTSFEYSCISNFPRASQSISFIRPSIAIPAAVPPRGAGWLHEIVIDGIRVQLHKSAGRVIIYGSDGQDLTAYLPSLRQNLLDPAGQVGHY